MHTQSKVKKSDSLASFTYKDNCKFAVQYEIVRSSVHFIKTRILLAICVWILTAIYDTVQCEINPFSGKTEDHITQSRTREGSNGLAHRSPNMKEIFPLFMKWGAHWHTLVDSNVLFKLTTAGHWPRRFVINGKISKKFEERWGRPLLPALVKAHDCSLKSINIYYFRTGIIKGDKPYSLPQDYIFPIN